MLKSSFRREGIAKARSSRPDLDPVGVFGGQAAFGRRAQAHRGQRRRPAIKWPADGQYLGDWKKGEKLAQSGRGMTWRDKAPTRRQRGPMLHVPPARQDRAVVRNDRPEPLQLRQDPRREEPERPVGGCDHPVHLGQALEPQGVQRMFEHAALRPTWSCSTENQLRGRDGAAAGPGLARQQVKVGQVGYLPLLTRSAALGPFVPAPVRAPQARGPARRFGVRSRRLGERNRDS